MPIDQDLLRRSGDLKRELVAFAHGPRYKRALQEARRESFGAAGARDEGENISFLDHFILQHRLADGRTVVDHFVDAHPELPAAERAMLLGWQDVVEGIFAVRKREGGALFLANLVDELTYRVHSNMGPRVFAQMPIGSFVIGRLVPIGDKWLISGAMNILQAVRRAEAYGMAARLAQQRPALVFRNPEKLRQAWEMQREERVSFIAFFGADLVTLPGHEVAERMRAYGHFRMYEERDAEGQSAADRARQTYGVVPSVPEIELPDEVLAEETVGLIYDEVDGLNFLADFGRVEEAFAHPNLASNRRYRQVLLDYLEDPSISPRLLRRLAERDPQQASQVFRHVLKQPHFSWERDGEALLRRYKASYFEHPVLPGITPVSEALAQAQLGVSPIEGASHTSHQPGRNDPCPCGSGKKYKKCCGA